MGMTKFVRGTVAALLATQLVVPYGITAQQSMNPAPSAMDDSIMQQPAPQPSTHPPLPSMTTDTSKSSAAPAIDLRKATALMSDDQIILHLLNRFAYGPRPGDVEKVRRMGVSAWLRQQLQPETIDDSALESRLDAFPAMKLPLDQLIVDYPNNAVIRRDMNGRGFDEPGGMAERAIYADQMEKYREKLTAKDDGGTAAGNTVNNAASTSAGDAMKSSASNSADSTPAPQKDFGIDALLAGTPESRFKFLCGLSNDDSRQLRGQLTLAQRERFLDGFTPQQREQVAALIINPRQLVVSEIEQTKLLRDIYSERQLNEVMTDFWLNHFNVYMAKSQESPYYIADYERNVVRPRALGSFENLLVATAESPAMLNYLDNEESIGPHSVAAERGGFGNKKSAGLNENYAREVMELHTVGVTGGYSQQDVTELAKVFTGWTIENQNTSRVRAVFDEDKHEGGTKIVMNMKIKDNGEKEGMQMLHMLATNPHTAHFVCQKLAVRFVSDDPSPALVDRMAATFLKSNGNIRSVLATMAASREFWAGANYHSKVKTPQDYIVSALRASGADVQSAGALITALTQLGMPLYGHQTPDGYNMRAEAWNSTSALVGRLNFAFALASNRIAGVTTDWDAVIEAGSGSNSGAATMTPAQKESALEAGLLHLPLADRTRQTILKNISGNSQQDQAALRQLVTRYQPRDPLIFAAMGNVPAPLDPQAALAAGFLIGSPDFQRR
jgi:uncharacterized protein (DUF1800 family)